MIGRSRGPAQPDGVALLDADQAHVLRHPSLLDPEIENDFRRLRRRDCRVTELAQNSNAIVSNSALRLPLQGEADACAHWPGRIICVAQPRLRRCG